MLIMTIDPWYIGIQIKREELTKTLIYTYVSALELKVTSTPFQSSKHSPLIPSVFTMLSVKFEPRFFFAFNIHRAYAILR